MLPNKDNTLVLIPARAGSKGVPNKNILPLAAGDSLVQRAIATALGYFSAEAVVLSSDSPVALAQARDLGVHTHERAEHLASDTAGMQEVMLEVLRHFGAGKAFLLLLQPTSPFRKTSHIVHAMQAFRAGDQAVVAMHETKAHPMFTLFRQEGDFVKKYAENVATRRQDLPRVLQVNGLLYLLSVDALQQGAWTQFDYTRPYVVDALEALDIDTPQDWWLAELILKNG